MPMKNFPVVNWPPSGFLCATLSLNLLTCRWSTKRFVKKRPNERITPIIDKRTCIKEQIYFKQCKFHLVQQLSYESFCVKFRAKFKVVLLPVVVNHSKSNFSTDEKGKLDRN